MGARQRRPPFRDPMIEHLRPNAVISSGPMVPLGEFRVAAHSL
jgi:hypothetical protein